MTDPTQPTPFDPTATPDPAAVPPTPAPLFGGASPAPDAVPPTPTPLFFAQQAPAPATMELAIQESVSHAQAGRLGQAIGALAPALAANPEHADGNGLMGTLLCAAGRPDQALPCLQRAFAGSPNNARIAYQYGAVLAMLGQAERGLGAMARAIELEPTWFQAHLGMAGVYQREGRYDQSERLYRRAIELQPENPDALCGLAGLLIVSGSPQEAVALFRKAGAGHPANVEVQGRLLSALNYADDATPEESFEAHKRWGSLVMAGAPAAAEFANSREPERKLRVGFLSPDLYDHSCAYFLRPILGSMDKAKVETVCYSASPRSDWMTDQLRSAADLWRDVAGLPAERLADLVRSDSLDILVELSGHTAAGPLAALKTRLAPVQMTYLGYPNTTGLPTIDYRIVDAVTDTPAADAFHTEKLLRLEGCFLCYSGADYAPEPSPPPCLGAGHVSTEAASDFASWLAPTARTPVTFGSFNSIRKLSPATIATWAAALKAVPGSRMLIKTRGLETNIARNTILKHFAGHGIEPARLGLADMVPSKSDHLAWYREVDIALDTFPYNGTTTTCEALWMGVPVVTIAGSAHAGRVGASLLTAAGMPGLIARDRDDFVQIAKNLSADPAKLAAMRAGMREKLRASPLMDAKAHAGRFESALRAAWRRYCQAR